MGSFVLVLLTLEASGYLDRKESYPEVKFSVKVHLTVPEFNDF